MGSYDFLVRKALGEPVHPSSQCPKCRYFVLGYCVLGILDENPDILFKAAKCNHYQGDES